MNYNEDQIEDIFADLDETNSSYTKNKDDEINVYINEDLLKDYSADPSLLQRDYEQGFLSNELYKAYKNAASNMKKESLDSFSSVQSNSKTLVKVNASGGIKKTIEVAGFVEPFLLSVIVSSLGLLYIGYLYLLV